mmetsp:Transcript_27654/g.64954  ORF Transcript_27654/g.64954 Transcript_27654/m.64954 type:complete len:82 (+) Transcript_27654:530-775(+)
MIRLLQSSKKKRHATNLVNDQDLNKYFNSSLSSMCGYPAKKYWCYVVGWPLIQRFENEILHEWPAQLKKHSITFNLFWDVH